MESNMKCTRCGTDTVTGPIGYVRGEGLCGLCWHDVTGEGTVVVCVECRRRYHLDGEVAERPVREICCFSCDFCRRCEAMRDNPEVVRVQGRHFLVGEPFLGMKGLGGERFVVEFFDGRQVETDCLWTQGAIPPHFRERLPDNARFL